MHYKNGREAKEGDAVVAIDGSKIIVGALHSLLKGTTTCNGTLTRVVFGGTRDQLINIKDSFHAEDAFRVADAFNAQVPPLAGSDVKDGADSNTAKQPHEK